MPERLHMCKICCNFAPKIVGKTDKIGLKPIGKTDKTPKNSIGKTDNRKGVACLND